jgi:hypothetical protein
MKLMIVSSAVSIVSVVVETITFTMKSKVFMKKWLYTLLAVALLVSCNSNRDNQALYDEVMNVHDEVMPKMDDIYKLKEQLKQKIADAPGMAEEKRKEIESVIARLDSAGDGMMIWMRNFNPLPDSLGEEKAFQYLQNEKQKIVKVKEDMLRAIDKAKELE